MRFLAKVLALKEGEADALKEEFHHLPYGLVDAVKKWNAGGSAQKRKNLDGLIEKYRKHFKDLPVKAEVSTLYRGIGIKEDSLIALLAGKSLTPLFKYESWTVNKSVARGFARSAPATSTGILFKKEIPEEERLVSLDNLGHDNHFDISGEGEVICKAQKLSWENNIRLFGQWRHGEDEEYGSILHNALMNKSAVKKYNLNIVKTLNRLTMPKHLKDDILREYKIIK